MCTSPFKVKVDDKIMDVPCGRCLNCRIEYTRSWAARIIHELDYYEKSSFLCLTYSDENLPPHGVSKDDLQRFFKRLRKNSGVKIKYLACGEYGETTRRPHYHVALLGIGLSQSDRELLNSSWGLGGVHFGFLNYSSARYVAGYVLKKYGQLDTDLPAGKLKEFVLHSKGLGKRFVEDNRDQLTQQLGFTIRGNKHQLPRYYRDKLGITCDDYQPLVVKTVMEQNKKLDALNVHPDDRRVYKQNQRDNTNNELRAKNKLLMTRDKI